MTMGRAAAGLAIVCLLLPVLAHAQPESPTIPGPPMLPNYERIPVGEREALEGGAWIARTDDANANWYNPAGLALVSRTSANLSASAYEATSLEVAGRRRETNSLRLAPLSSFFGLAIGEPITSSERMRWGMYIAQPLAWQSGTLDAEEPVDARSTFTGISEARLTRIEPGLSLGMRMGPAFRLGGSLGVSVTTIDLSQDLALRGSDTDSASTLRRTIAVAGTAWHLVPRVGVQWDLGERWRLGAVATAPGLQMMGSTRLAWNTASFGSDDRYIDVALRDEEADLEYELPFNAGIGIARTFDRGAIEATVRYYGSAEEHDLISTDVMATRVDAPSGAPPTVTPVAVNPIPNAWREVTNIAIGGHWKWTEALRLHFGINSDRSPVADPQRSAFRKVDLIGGTAGLSYQGPRFGGSLGLGYSSGESDPIESLAGTTLPVETRLKVSTFRAMYSFSARF
jgi:long-subunit fatty acid transport protein